MPNPACTTSTEMAAASATSRRTAATPAPTRDIASESDADSSLDAVGVDPRVALDLARFRKDAAVPITDIDQISILERHRHTRADGQEQLGQRRGQIVAEV